MKKYLLFIVAIMISSIAFSQSWPDAETANPQVSISLQGIPSTYEGYQIVVIVEKAGTLYNIGQGVVPAASMSQPIDYTFNGFLGSNVGDGDAITLIQVYDGVNAFFEFDISSGVQVVETPFPPFASFFNVAFDNGNTPLNPSNQLPVELTSFTGSFSNEAVTLNWATASEENNEFFTVERSINGSSDFKALKNIAGAGTTIEAQEYQYSDEQPESGVNYYRLKQTDFDGNFTYSEVIAVKADETPLTVNIFPNPVVSIANIALPAVDGDVTIKVMDLSGREVLSQTVSNTNRQNVQLDMNELQAGMYMVVITNGEQVVTKQIQLTK